MKQHNSQPTFICIGPAKTGTSWLYINLRRHPDVFMPYKKEVRYFWAKHRLNNTSVLKRLTGKNHYFQSIRRHMKKQLLIYAINIRRRKKALYNILRWDFRFFFLPYSDKWYLSLFKSDKKVSGDISPIYCALKKNEIQEIKSLLPDVKIIILLRNPIERDWSNAKMTLIKNRGKKTSNVPDKDFFRIFDRYYSNLHSYTALINKWTTVFGDDQVHVNFYDKLRDEPEVFIQEICDFLQLDFNKFSRFALNKFREKKKQGIDLEIPAEFAQYLATKYQDTIDELCKVYEPYPQQWAKSCSEILSLKNA